MFALLLLSNFLNFKVFGFAFSGWSWVILLAASLARLAGNLSNVKLPLLIWTPWCALVFVYTFAGYEYAWQSTAQILCPVVVGAAISTYRFGPDILRKVDKTIRTTYWFVLAGNAFIVIPFSLDDIENSGWAAGSIALLFFQAWFLSSYILNGRNWRDLVLYLSAVIVPIVGANRGPILASVVLVLASILPIRFSYRLALFALIAVTGIAAFYTPKVQNKMFYSGRGSFQDLNLDNPNLRTNGRSVMWQSLNAGIEDAPWLGHGGNADRTWLLAHGFHQYLPHNDWLRIRFNYGTLGVFVYALTLLAQIMHARQRLRWGTPLRQTIVAAGITCMLPFATVMYTDNVLIYCQYFTVPMLTLIAITYATTCSRRRRVPLSLRAR